MTELEIIQREIELLERARKLKSKTSPDVQQTLNVDINKNQKPVYNLSKFDSIYNKPRVYDALTERWHVKGTVFNKNFYLPIDDLFIIIDDYQNKRPLKYTLEKIEADITHAQLTSYQYMYRAGSFNDEIIKYATKFGLNYNELISHECEGI